MARNILLLAHVDESGNTLPKAAYECLGAALELAECVSGALTVGIIGEDIQSAANTIASTGVSIFGVAGTEFAHPRYATDAAALEAICREAIPDIVIAPATSRFLRVMAGVAQRLNGQIDTHITAIEVIDGQISAKRWFYRQRLEAVIQRHASPWFLVMDPGCHELWIGASAVADIKKIEVVISPDTIRTVFAGIRAPKSAEQTIRPDAKLLFVAGAGWCKKQADGKTHLPEAETTILQFLRSSGASLGGSKSLVDQSGESQAVLGFMTHLNQIGQTGSTPRHPKGLSTCCHGEEPHVVGWRFINERRAINLDPNCGWARGKADVLYVADAFQVMAKLHLLLTEQSKEDLAAVPA
ncbi:MAG: hypothetical protein WA485_22360 [Candidatus Sulfotelmatobacter sp.]